MLSIIPELMHLITIKMISIFCSLSKVSLLFIVDMKKSEKSADSWRLTDEKLRRLRGINFHKAYKCFDCGKKFSSIIEYKLHHLSDHKENRQNFEEVVDDSVINHCSICQKNFPDSDQFIDHFLSHVWDCHHCTYFKGRNVKAMISTFCIRKQALEIQTKALNTQISNKEQI